MHIWLISVKIVVNMIILFISAYTHIPYNTVTFCFSIKAKLKLNKLNITLKISNIKHILNSALMHSG